MQIKITMIGRHPDHFQSFDQLLASAPIFDQFLNRADFQAVVSGEVHQLRQARHGPVLAHDFANHADRPATREFHQIDRRFRVTRALQHTAPFGAERKDVPRLH